MHTTQENRNPSTSLVSLFGLLVGVICYLVAEWLTPKQVASPGDHDILLATRLGFIYTPIIGLWLGWLQKSWPRAIAGAFVGLLIGLIYVWLCSSRNFLAVMVGFPCLLGGMLAMILGSNRSLWLEGSISRFWKGLLAGLILGFVYMLTLNIVGGMVRKPSDTMEEYTRNYILMMWTAGPVALGLSSALFFILIRWAVNLVHVKILLFETVEPQNTNKPQLPSTEMSQSDKVHRG